MYILMSSWTLSWPLGGPKAEAAIQPIPAPRKSVLTVTKKPEKPSPVLANRSPAPGPGKEVTSRRKEEKTGEKDFLLTEMQALLDPLQSGKVKGEELRHILASIGSRWTGTIFWNYSIVSRLSGEDLALVKSFEDKDGMIEYQRFLETIIMLWTMRDMFFSFSIFFSMFSHQKTLSCMSDARGREVFNQERVYFYILCGFLS